MERAKVHGILLAWCRSLLDRPVHYGPRGYRCFGALYIAGTLAGCQVTQANGNLSTGEFGVTSLRLMTDTGLGVKGPNNTAINLTSNPNAQLTSELVNALVSVSKARIPAQFHATDPDETVVDD